MHLKARFRFFCQGALVVAAIFVFFYSARTAAGFPFIEERLPHYVIYLISTALVWSMMWRVRGAYLSTSFASPAVVRWLIVAFGMVVLPVCLGTVIGVQARWFGYHAALQATELRSTVTAVRQFRKFRTGYVQLTLANLSSSEPETQLEWQVAGSSLEHPHSSWVGKTACLITTQAVFGMHVRSLKLC